MPRKKPDIKPKNADASPKERPKSGKGAMNGVKTGRSFTKENQPSPEVKRAGHIKKKVLREFLSMPLSQSKLPKKYETFIQECIKAYGIKREEVDIRLFMDMKMASQAIVNGDVAAYKAILDRALGKPMQEQPPVIESQPEEKTFVDLGDGNLLEI